MPVVSAPNLVKLRTTRHSTLLRLAVYTPATMWTARVDGTQTTGDTTITVKTVVQTKAPFKNARVLFGSTAGGSEYGEARFRSYTAPTLTVGAHNVALADNTYVTIVEEIKPAAIHPNISDTDVITEDGNVAYTNENVQYKPIAKMGAPAVAFIDPATGLATVNFYSRASAYGGATLSTHAWVFPSGTPGTSAIAGTSGAPIAVTWDTAGQYYVSYTVTDSNGKTHTTYRPVFILNQNSGVGYYTQIETGGIEGDVESGTWQTSLTVWTSASTTAFPENALCVLFAEDRYGDTAGSIGNELYRENIVMVGYIRRGSIRKNPFTGSVEFAVESVSGVMDNLWCLAGGLETTAGTPAGWHTLKNMTYELAAHHVLTQHSTITQIADCTIGIQSYTIEFVDLTDASLMENLRQVVAAVRGRAGCSAQGSLVIQDNPQLVAPAGRSTDYVLTLTLADVRDEIDFGDELQEKEVSQIDFCGDDANADPVFSLAPATPWSSGHSERIDSIRVANQTEANTFAGLYEGYRNNSFADVVIQWRGNYRVFDIFPSEPIAVTIDANQNARGIAWTAQRCWVKRVSMEYTPGILLVTTNVEKDAYGGLGVTGDYPPVEPTPPTPPVPPVEPPIVPPPEPPVTVPQGKGNLLYVSSLKGVAKCVMAYGTNGTDGAPVWTDISSPYGLAGDALKIRAFNLDPWSVSIDHFTAAWVMTDDGLYRCTGLPDAPVWTQQLSKTAAAALVGFAEADTKLCWAFTPSVRLAGFIMCAIARVTSYGSIRRMWILYSLDYGATWNCDTSKYTEVSQTAAGLQTILNMAASYHIDSTYYLHGYQVGFRGNQDHASGIGGYWSPQLSIHRSAVFPVFDGGMSGGATWEAATFISPYCDNAGAVYTNDNRGYLINANGDTGANAIRRYTDLFNPAWSLGYAPRVGTGVGHADMGTVLLTMNMFDENAMYSWGGTTLWVSSNGGTAWTKYINMAVGGRGANLTSMYNVPVDATITFLSGYPNGGAGIARVGMTIDRGATWVAIDKQGLAGSLDTVLSLAAGDCDQSQIIVDYYKT